MRHALIALAVLTIAAGPILAVAPPAGKTFITHEMDGLVFQMNIPPTWKVEHADRTNLKLSAPSAKHTSQKMQVTLYIRAIEKKYLASHGWKPDGSASAIDVLTSWIKNHKYFQVEQVFNDSAVTVAGMKGKSRTLGATSYKDPKTKKDVPVKAPTMKIYHLMTSEYVYVRVSIQSSGILPVYQDVYAELAPAFERFIESMRLLDTAKMTAKEKADTIPEYHSSSNPIISRRMGYYLKARAEFPKPPGWTVKETTRRNAVEGPKQGLSILEITPPIKVKENQAPPRAMIVMQGLTPGPLNPSDFLGSLDAHIKGLLPQAKLLSTTNKHFMGMVKLAMSATRYITPTKKTFIRTYSGKDPYGRTLKIRAYTAGGMSMACHIILIADDATYTEIQPKVDEVLDLIRIRLQSPSIRYPN